MDIVIICMLILSIIINIIVLLKYSKSNNIEEHIISELKINLGQNNLNLIDSITKKISESDEKQLKELLTNKLETVERLEINTTRMTESFGVFRDNTTRTINDSNNKLTESLNNNFTSLTGKISESLDKINMRVEERLNEGFEKTNKTFVNILERLSKIDEAQKKIDSLSSNIISLQDVLTDK